ncbi:hypothetical protein FB451DRAFT_1568415 [Mycena latifolia]|nr:hypothetical protein FB451DRAFT_1568415 [Mycena latifolia]
MPPLLRDPSMESAAIYCGAEAPSASIDFFEDNYDEHRPWELQILPEEHSPPPPRSSMPKSRSNGCGASVHVAASLTGRNQCWFGWQDGMAPTVVPLDTVYFPPDVAEFVLKNKGRSACGGNALGTRSSPCDLHSSNSSGRDGFFFLTSAVSAARTSSSRQYLPTPVAAASPVQHAQTYWPRDPLGSETVDSSAPSHVAFTSTAYSPVAPAGYIPFIPPSPVPPQTASSSSVPPAASALTSPTPARRPIRRQPLRRPASVERHFGPDDAAVSSSISAWPSARGDPPDAGSGYGGGGATGTSEYYRTLTAPALPVPIDALDDMPPLVPDPYTAWARGAALVEPTPAGETRDGTGVVHRVDAAAQARYERIRSHMAARAGSLVEPSPAVGMRESSGVMDRAEATAQAHYEGAWRDGPWRATHARWLVELAQAPPSPSLEPDPLPEPSAFEAAGRAEEDKPPRRRIFFER